MTDPASEIDADRQRLAELLVETGAFQYSPDKPFELASGETSPFYFDLRLLNGHPEGINAVAWSFYRRIKEMREVRSVGGLEAGSISIATAVSQLSYFENQKDPSNPLLTSFYVRKASKAHGTRKMIEGKISSPAVIVDDVITSGMSAASAARAIQEQRCECRALMSIIFRGTEECRKSLEGEYGLEYIFHKDQLVKQFKELTQHPGV